MFSQKQPSLLWDAPVTPAGRWASRFTIASAFMLLSYLPVSMMDAGGLAVPPDETFLTLSTAYWMAAVVMAAIGYMLAFAAIRVFKERSWETWACLVPVTVFLALQLGRLLFYV